jgi:hypothetical protein
MKSHRSDVCNGSAFGMRSRCARRGQALVEFAVVALVIYLLLAAILTFGLLFWSGSTIQQAVEIGVQEIARMPLPPEAELGLGNLSPPSGTIMDRPAFQAEIYDESLLVIPETDIPTGQRFVDYAAANLPLINRLLSSVYIFDDNYGGGVYRYPGTIVRRNDSDTVLIPIVRNDGSVRWVAPVEEIRISDGSGGMVGPFSVTASAPTAPNFIAGTVALRINYPFQSAAMSSFGPRQNGDSNIDQVVSADEDAALVNALDGALPNDYTLRVNANDYVDKVSNIHGGRYGMGRQIALPFESVGNFGVRPYRRVISAQAVFRREAFGP